MAQRVEVTVNVGAGAPIEVVRQVIDDLDTVCQFGGELQYQAAVTAAEWAVLRNPADWIRGNEEYEFFVQAWGGRIIGRPGPLRAMPAEILTPAVSRYLYVKQGELGHHYDGREHPLLEPH
jgi:hypothetical protein